MNPELNFDQIETDLELYEFGRQLRVIVNSPGWEIVVETIQNMRDDAVKNLIALAPGDPSVVAAHAAASAVNDFVKKFLEATQKAVDFASRPSEEVVTYLSQARDASDVMKAMGQGE